MWKARVGSPAAVWISGLVGNRRECLQQNEENEPGCCGNMPFVAQGLVAMILGAIMIHLSCVMS